MTKLLTSKMIIKQESSVAVIRLEEDLRRGCVLDAVLKAMGVEASSSPS